MQSWRSMPRRVRARGKPNGANGPTNRELIEFSNRTCSDCGAGGPVHALAKLQICVSIDNCQFPGHRGARKTKPNISY